MRRLIIFALLRSVTAACPNLSTLRSANVTASFSAALANGVFFENRYTDLAQIGARCQTMNKTAAADGLSISESYDVYYGPLRFPLPLYYNASGLPRGVSARYMTLFPELTFPSVVMDFDVDATTGRYSALLEYLCWEIPVLNLDYVELRISTRSPNPSAAYLDSLQARAAALGAKWDGSLTTVNFTGCPAPTAVAAATPPPARLAPWAATRAALGAGTWRPPVGNASDDVVLPGMRPGLPQIALIFIQGAECPPSAYVPLLKAVQVAQTDFDVIVGAPDAPLIHTPDPVSIGLDVARVLATMEASAGLDMKTAKVVFVAHSLGGLMLQDWLAIADFVTYEPAAVILLGSYIMRSNRPGINASDGHASFRFPTLSIGGELDGLTRVSRLAEAFWWQQTRQVNFPALQAAFPVIVIPGMNHGQWAVFDGPAPNEVATYDLEAEITSAQALAAGAAALANYVSAVVGGSATAAAAVAKSQAASATFLAPLLNAQLFESSYNLLPPCYDAPPSPSCQVGSAFSEWAQHIMTNSAESGAEGSDAPFPYHAVVVDAMHPVADLHPIHLSNITNQCAAPTAACTLLASTVTENTYDPIFSELDVALYPTSPHEVKVKLTSRQNGMLHAGVAPQNAEFNVTDSASLCAVINNATFFSALADAAPATAARYLRRGLPLRFGPDNIGFAGPQFTDGTLQFGLVNDTEGTFVWVNSTSLPTPIPYFVKLAEGFHYCLLMSPSRAMEWIYVDGLRDILVQ